MSATTDPRTDLKYIPDLAESLKIEFSGQTALDKRMGNMYMIRNPMEVEKPKKEIGVRRIDTGLAGVTVDQDVSALDGEWKVSVLARGGQDAEAHASDTLEPFAAGALKVMQKRRSVQYPVALDIDIYGRAFTLGPLPAPQFWGDPELIRLIDELEETEDEKESKKLEAAIERFKQARFPIVWRHFGAPSVLPVFGDDDDLSEIVVLRKMRARQIKDRWGDDALPGPRQKEKGSTEIDVIEYANKAFMAVSIPDKEDPKVVHSWEHLMGAGKGGRVPFAFFEGKRAPENEFGIIWRGALFHLEEVIQAMDETVTDIRTSLRDQVSNKLFVKLNQEARSGMEGWPEKIDFNEDMNLLIGEEVGQVETAQIRNDAYQLIDRLKAIADQVGVRRDPLIGAGPAGESAVRMNVGNQAAKSELRQEKNGLERGAIQTVELTFESVRALSRQFPNSPDEVTVRGEDSEHGSREIAVTPKNVEEWEPMVDVTIPMNLPVDAAGLSQNASILTSGDRPLLSHRTVRQRDLGVDNPIQEQDFIDEEQDREAIKPLLRMHLLNLLGLGGDMTLEQILQAAQEIGPGFAQVFAEILGNAENAPPRSVSTAGTNAGREGRGQALSDLEGLNTQLP